MNGIITGQIITQAMQDQFTYDDDPRDEDDRPTWIDRWGKFVARLTSGVARNERYPRRPQRAPRSAYASRS